VLASGFKGRVGSFSGAMSVLYTLSHISETMTEPLVAHLPTPDHLPPPANPSTLAQRLLWGAEYLGGKRALAAAAEISEAQLYRYLEGAAAIPHDKLEALATACGADPAWVLTGRGPWQRPTNRVRPEFRGQLLQEIEEHLDLLLVEYQRSFTPQMRSRMVRYLYEVLRFEEVRTGVLVGLDRFKMLQYLSFLGELKTTTELEILREAFDILEYRDLTPEYAQHHQLLTTWCNLLVRGMRGYYNSYAGQVYFERMGQSLAPDAIAELQNIVNFAIQQLGKQNLRWLDLGCGNGRHLAHLYKFIPNLVLSGMELSDLGVELCQKLEKSERLPVGCVSQGDMRLIPYKSSSFDIIYARLSLQYLPLLPHTSIGLAECLEELGRIIEPGGLLVAICPMGEGFDYKLPFQYLSPEILNRLLTARWECVSLQNSHWKTLSIDKKNQRQAAGEFTMIWQKKA
jgi:SAM-dependent methyltransferase